MLKVIFFKKLKKWKISSKVYFLLKDLQDKILQHNFTHITLHQNKSYLIQRLAVYGFITS